MDAGSGSLPPDRGNPFLESSADAGDASEVSSSLSSLSLQSGSQHLASVEASQASAAPRTPQFSLPAKPHADDVKKQLFPGEPPRGLDSTTGGAGAQTPLSLVPPQQQQQQQGEISDPDSIPDQGQAEASTRIESPRELRLVIDPNRAAQAGREISDPSPSTLIGMSPGARSFAPPFGAKFGDRNNPKAGAGRKEMELVQEEDDAAVHSGEPSPDGPSAAAAAIGAAAPAAAAPAAAVAALAAAGSFSPAAPSSPSVVSQAAEDAFYPGSPTTGLGFESSHAHRVASSTAAATAAAAAGAAGTGDCSSRPRFRMAFEGRRDDGVLVPTDSKFAPTPRVKPRDGLPWGR